jgi:hypothetical protein
LEGLEGVLDAGLTFEGPEEEWEVEEGDLKEAEVVGWG